MGIWDTIKEIANKPYMADGWQPDVGRQTTDPAKDLKSMDAKNKVILSGFEMMNQKNKANNAYSAANAKNIIALKKESSGL